MREEFEKDLYPRSSRSASGELLPLDKDLSWKSREQLVEKTVLALVRAHTAPPAPTVAVQPPKALTVSD